MKKERICAECINEEEEVALINDGGGPRILLPVWQVLHTLFLVYEPMFIILHCKSNAWNS